MEMSIHHVVKIEQELSTHEIKNLKKRVFYVRTITITDNKGIEYEIDTFSNTKETLIIKNKK